MRRVTILLSVSMLACGEVRPAPRVQPPEVEAPEETAPEELAPPTARLDLPPVVRLPIDDERAIDRAVATTIANGDLPGCVLVIGRSDGIVFQRAYGDLSIEPARVRMPQDALFDLASLTKLFTAVAVLQLVERGELDLDASVDASVDAPLPELAGHGITIRQLLTHTAGLRAVNPLGDYDDDRDASLSRALRSAPERAPGLQRYSDLGYLALGVLVARTSGLTFDAHLQQHVLEPLGLDARFNPGAQRRVVPTERARHRGDPPPIIHGEANDPRAWRLGGIAGHAGLFATGDAMARFAEALLGTRPLLNEESRALFSQPLELRRRNGRLIRRSLTANMERRSAEGWSSSAFGHGGYTGTWLWVDPARDLYVVLLSSRVHPNGGGRAGPLRAMVSNIANAALPRLAPQGEATSLGIDVLRAENFTAVEGRRVALLTNDSGRARDGSRTWELLRDAPEVSLIRVFTPEHGLGANREGAIDNGRLESIEVVSLFGEHRRPDPASLTDIDVVVVDLQDVGARFYTYGATLRRMMEVAAETHTAVLVLDRPNPIDGVTVSGPMLQEPWRSFVNHQPGWPVRHGMTLGEIARLLKTELELELELGVVELRGWQRFMRWPDTGLRWVPPSPNLRTADQVLLYPGVALVEGTNVSVGRGTDHPFERIGAPWMNPERVIAALPPEALSGLDVLATRFRPTSARHRNVWCRGIALRVDDAAAVRPLRLGLALLRALATTHPEQWESERAVRIIGDSRVMEALEASDLSALEAIGAGERQAFEERRRHALLY